MNGVNRVEVVINGEIITLMSAEDEGYMHGLARYIDRKLAQMKEINSNATINERTRTVFIAINIADDYFKAKDKSDGLEAELDKYVVELGRIQEENLLLTEKIHELQDQLNQSRRELDDYIESFDRDNVVHFSGRTYEQKKSSGAS